MSFSTLVDGELQLNAVYSSLNSFIQALQTYISLNGVTLHRSDSHKINYKKMQPQLVDEVIKKFTYSNMTYTCQFNRRKSRAKSFSSNLPKENCKFKIVINLTNDLKYLKITRMSDQSDHNHPINGTKSSLNSKIYKDQLEVGQSGHMISIMQHLSELRKLGGQFCDTIIRTRDGTLYAHSGVLGIACPRLGVYLNRYPIFNLVYNNIDMTKYGKEEVQSLLDFFYEGHLNMDLIDKIVPLAADLGVRFNIQGNGQQVQSQQVQSQQVPADLSKNATNYLVNNKNNNNTFGISKSKSKAKSKSKKLSIRKVKSNDKKPVKEYRKKSIVKSYRCGDCGKLNQSRRELLLHKLVYCPLSMFRIKDYCCKVCDAAFKSIQALHNHMNVSHGIKKAKFKCQRCKFFFFYKRNLISHQNKNNCIEITSEQCISTNISHINNNCEINESSPLHIETNKNIKQLSVDIIEDITSSIISQPDKMKDYNDDIYDVQMSQNIVAIDVKNEDCLNFNIVDENVSCLFNVEKNSTFANNGDANKNFQNHESSSNDNSIYNDESMKSEILNNQEVISTSLNKEEEDDKTSNVLILTNPVSNMYPSSSHSDVSSQESVPLKEINEDSNYVNLQHVSDTLQDSLLVIEDISKENISLQLNREENSSPLNIYLDRYIKDEENMNVTEFKDLINNDKGEKNLGDYPFNNKLEISSLLPNQDGGNNYYSLNNVSNEDNNFILKIEEVNLNEKPSNVDEDCVDL